MAAELFHADGRTDRQTDITKVVGAFRNFANSPKMEYTAILIMALKSEYNGTN